MAGRIQPPMSFLGTRISRRSPIWPRPDRHHALNRRLGRSHLGDLGPGPFGVRACGPNQPRHNGCNHALGRGRCPNRTSDRPMAADDDWSDGEPDGLGPVLDSWRPSSSAASAVLQHVGDHFRPGSWPFRTPHVTPSDSSSARRAKSAGASLLVRRPRKGPDEDETCHDRRRFLGDSRPEAIGLWSGS